MNEQQTVYLVWRGNAVNQNDLLLVTFDVTKANALRRQHERFQASLPSHQYEYWTEERQLDEEML